MMNTHSYFSPVPASTVDLWAVLALLDAEHLPTADVGLHVKDFFVIRDAHRVIGAIGTETYGSDALLRSLIVAPDRRSRGLGRRLVEHALAASLAQDVRTVYVLTQSAERFAETLGFERCDRATVPAAIARTSEFASLCPASAVCMRRDLLPSICTESGGTA